MVLERNESAHVETLKEAIKNNPDLKQFSSLFDDDFILGFIRGRKYKDDVALQTLKNFIEVRTKKYPDLFRDLRPSTTGPFNDGVIRILKNRDGRGRPVLISRIKLWDANIHNRPEDCLQVTILLADELLRTESAQKNGVVVIFDLDGYSFAHAKAATPPMLLKAARIFVNAMPLQYKAIHIVNEIYLFSLMFKGVRPFLPKLIQERLRLHGSNLESLHKDVSPHILPKSLGGSLTEEEAFDPQVEIHIRNRENYYQGFATEDFNPGLET